MKSKPSKALATKTKTPAMSYDRALSGIIELLEKARRASARAVNSIMTATYWEVGRRIVEVEQGNKQRKEYYGDFIVDDLSKVLSARFGRGYGRRNLFQMRSFYLTYSKKVQTVSALSSSAVGAEIVQTLSGKSDLASIAKCFPLSWSHYVALLGVENEQGREFYEVEALRGGWTERQLRRQIGTQFFERTALSKDKVAMLTKGAKAKPEDAMTPEEEIKSPFILEFLNLKDEFSETELEEALIKHLEAFLLELGDDFAFIGRQRRLRIGDNWFRVDLVFFHRRLRSLLIIDLKLDKFTHADVGQMHLYCNYAKHHWVLPGENPPIGLILCAKKDETLVEYALEGLPNKIMVSKYLTALPDKKMLTDELVKTRRLLEERQQIIGAAKKATAKAKGKK
jgi:predicted nuclease of restriction endonuclease-like (RecB) superfamily